MNLIVLMRPLSLIKRLKIHLQATCVFFCAISVVQLYFLNTDLIWLVTHSTFYSVVWIRNVKKLINIYFLNLINKIWYTFNKVRKKSCKSL